MKTRLRPMDSRRPSRERSLAMILALIDGNDFNCEEKNAIRRRLNQPSRLVLDSYPLNSKGRG